MFNSELNSPKKNLSNRPKSSKRSLVKSIGTKLFVSVLGGAFLGLSGTAYLFYETLEKQTTYKIQQIVDVEVQQIEAELKAVAIATTNLGVAAQFAKEQKIQDNKAYEALVLDFFHKRPKLAMAAYFLQSPRGILESREWYAPYFYQDQQVAGQLGQRLPEPDRDIIYSDLFQDDNYPIRNYYQIPSYTKAPVWIEPYLWYGFTITTFATPISDRDNKIIGYAATDVNVTDIAKAIDSTVTEGQGYFALISEQGKMLSYSPDPQKALDRVGYDSIPELKAIWKQIQGKKAGVFESGGKYWSFQRLPSTKWLLVAAVPESVVDKPILTITLAGVFGASLILAGAVYWFVRRFNRRLQPILAECEKLGEIDPKIREEIQQKDEIDGLSISIFQLLQQLAAEKEQTRQESEARLLEVGERLKLSQEKEKEAEILQQEIGKILDVVATLETGDFTVKAEVNEGITGLVADNLNRFAEEISFTLSTVSNTAKQVSESSQLMEELAKDVATNAAQQAQGANMALQLTDSVNKTARNSSQQLDSARLKLDRMNEAVEKGKTEIQVMGLAINSLQRGKEQMLQQMTTLGEFADTAEQFVEEQGQIASLSQTLAMSANLLAARAAEQKDPRQFLSVAKEFETIAAQMKTLAQQTTSGLNVLQKRTDLVRSAVGTVGKEVDNMANLVENFTEGVNLSQEIFNRVDLATTELIEVEASVVASNESIVESARSSAKAMQDIAIVAAQTASLTQTTNQQSEAMKQLALDLIRALSLFTLQERSN